MLILFLIIQYSLCGYYQPHLFPQNGPFFEGWYMRLQDNNSDFTYGFLFGKVLPRDESKMQNPNYLSIVRSKGIGRPMEAYDEFPKKYEITINNQPVTQNPGKDDIADFKFVSEFGFMEIAGDTITWDFDFKEVAFSGSGKGHKFFRDDGLGPAGWTEYLPLPLHWFVYSVGTHIDNFQFINKNNPQDQQKGSGTLHMEKNWGSSFPDSWIWAQGHDSLTGATVLSAGGPLPGTIGTYLPGKFQENHLIDYLNPQKQIRMAFSPQNSQVISSQSDQDFTCQGILKIEARNLSEKLEIEYKSDISLFQTCLLGPSEDGFIGMAVESYETTVYVKAYVKANKLNPLSDWIMIDEQVFKNGALEFGGNYICKKQNPCKSKKHKKVKKNKKYRRLHK